MRRFGILGLVIWASLLGASADSGVTPKARSAACGELPDQELDLERLTSFIETCRITDLDQLIALLPQRYRERYVLQYQSLGLQKATPRFPRVISFGRTAQLILAFTGSPSLEGYSSLEAIQWREKDKAFEFRDAVFAGGSVTLSERNPPRCLACHGQDPRPLFQPYRLWPGFYGAEDDGHFSQWRDYFGPSPTGWAREIALYRDFQSNLAPRYRSLKLLEQKPVGGQVSGPPRDFFSEGGYLTALSEVMYGLNYQRMIRKIMSSAKLRPYRYAFALIALCPPGTVETAVPEKIRKAWSSTYASLLGPTDAMKLQAAQDNLDRDLMAAGLTQSEAIRLRGPDAVTQIGHAYPPDFATAMRLLVENNGESLADWAPSSGEIPLEFFAGNNEIRVFGSELVKEIQVADPSVTPACGLLRDRSIRELSGN